MATLYHQLSNVKSRYFTTSIGLNLEYRIKGPEHADAVVLVHQVGMDCRSYLPNIDALAESFLVLAISLRGQGLSDRPPKENESAYLLHVMLRDLIELTWGANLQQFHYVGHGLGGILGYELLAQDPTSLLSLTTFGAPADSSGAKGIRRFIGRSTGLRAKVRNLKKRASRTAKKVSLHGQSITFLKDEIFYATNWQAARLIARQLANYNYIPQLKQAEIPILVLAGEQDQIVKAKQLIPTTKAIQAHPHARFQIIRDAGHAPNIDQPFTFNQTLINFLQNG